jgi:hypothetical protein
MANSANLKLVDLVVPPASTAPSTRAPAPLGDTGFRANPDAFAAQMAVFGRMRETEYAFRQRAKRD